MSFLTSLMKLEDPFKLNPLNQSVQGMLGGKGGGDTSSGIGYLSSNPQALAAFNAKYPNYLATYNAAGGAAGLHGRSYTQWLSDHFKANPGDATNQAALQSIGLYQSSGSMEPAAPAAPAATQPSVDPTGGTADGSTPVTPDSAGTQAPVEKGLYDMVMPGIMSDIAGDADRRTLAGTLGKDAQSAYQSAYGSLQSAQGPTFDSESYYAANPDVAEAYAKSDHSMTAQKFAQNHYETVGKTEGRQGTYNSQLQRENQNADNTAASLVNNANTSAASQLAAIQKFASTAQTSLSGELGTRASALKQQVADLLANSDKYTEAQKATLLAQITGQTKNLQDSITSQKSNLQSELSQLGDANDANASTRKAALNSMISQLNDAQAPLNNARLSAANDQVTAVNLGLQHTEDQLTANQAQQGYVGGDTASEGNLARAAIDARQRAAGYMGQAKVSNATDDRDIGVKGATEGRTLADALAAQRLNLDTFGATEGRSLADQLATGTRTINDYGVNSTAGIAQQDAAAKLGIGNNATNQTYSDTTYGAAQKKAIEDAANNSGLGVSTDQARSIQLANNAAAAAKSSYFDNNYNRSIQSALTLPSLTTNLANTLTGLDNYGNSGLTRGLNTLNWWSTTGTPSTPGYVAVQPDQSGNALGQLGAGLLGTAANIGSANNWWQTPSKTTGVGAATSYSNFLKANPSSSAAAGTGAGSSYTPIDTNWSFEPSTPTA